MAMVPHARSEFFTPGMIAPDVRMSAARETQNGRGSFTLNPVDPKSVPGRMFVRANERPAKARAPLTPRRSFSMSTRREIPSLN